MTRNHGKHVEAAAYVTRSNASQANVPPNTPPPKVQTTSFSSEGTLTPDSQDSLLAKMADAFSTLTHGALRQITDGTLAVEEPVFQCLQIKTMSTQQGVERYRVVMSDGTNFMQGMLGQRK